MEGWRKDARHEPDVYKRQLLAIFLFAAVREQLEISSDNPKAFDGFPIALVTAGLMALAFMGFSGLKVW